MKNSIIFLNSLDTLINNAQELTVEAQKNYSSRKLDGYVFKCIQQVFFELNGLRSAYYKGLFTSDVEVLLHIQNITNRCMNEMEGALEDLIDVRNMQKHGCCVSDEKEYLAVATYNSFRDLLMEYLDESDKNLM